MQAAPAQQRAPSPTLLELTWRECCVCLSLQQSLPPLCRAIVSIALHPDPLYSHHQVRTASASLPAALKAQPDHAPFNAASDGTCHHPSPLQAGHLPQVGTSATDLLKDKAALNRVVQRPPPRGRYASACEAALVALREYEEDGHGDGAEMPGAALVEAVAALLEPDSAWVRHVRSVAQLFPTSGGAGTPWSVQQQSTPN